MATDPHSSTRSPITPNGNAAGIRADHDDLSADRRETDDSLRAERSRTDELLGDRTDEIVQDTRTEAEHRLQNARDRADAVRDEQRETLVRVSEEVEQVADSLTNAAASLAGVAGSLQETLEPTTGGVSSPDTGSHEPVHLAASIAHVAEQFERAADDPPESTETVGKLTQQLAEIADGMAEVTATLAEERHDVDEGLSKERSITDRIVHQELEKVGTEVAQSLQGEERFLTKERDATDEDLAEERRHTDQAVDHVLGLLAAERRAHEAAERHVATRNEFLSMVSHDLRAPLTAISGAADLIHAHASADPAGDQIQGWANLIRDAVATMARLIGDLLDFRSLEDGQLRVVAHRHDLAGVIRDEVAAFQVIAAAKSLSLDADLPEGAVMAKFDPHRIHQVLANLLHNAMKYTPDGGSIRVRVRRTGTEAVVGISDTGSGIPGSDLTSIFERFRQLNVDRTGFGLGLYISAWIVEAHGGRIWAESEVGVGSTFYFTLPAK